MLYFYIHSKGISDVDLSAPEKGNPGVGGTQYLFVFLAYCLAKYANKEVCFLSHVPLKLPTNCINKIVPDFNRVCKILTERDFIVCKTPMSVEDYIRIKNSRGNFICWSHNYFKYDWAYHIAKTDNIVANVFVSKQMYDFYIDCDLIKKSCYIFNMVPDTLGDCKRKTIPHTLVFQGSLQKDKGIFDLFKIWSIVEQRCPDAQLYIIGKSNLYDHDLELGKTGALSSSLEKQLSKKIYDHDGNVKSNIHFLGTLGEEKYDIFLKSSVGMVNPSAKTETFGLGIVEMATAKLPVVTKNWNAHPDIAVNGQSALLSFTNEGMAQSVLKLFQDKELNNSMGIQGKLLCTRFDPKKITEQWNVLIETLANGTFEPQRCGISKPFWNNYKFLRAINAFVRFNCGLNFIFPVVWWETKINSFLKKIR